MEIYPFLINTMSATSSTTNNPNITQLQPTQEEVQNVKQASTKVFNIVNSTIQMNSMINSPHRNISVQPKVLVNKGFFQKIKDFFQSLFGKTSSVKTQEEFTSLFTGLKKECDSIAKELFSAKLYNHPEQKESIQNLKEVIKKVSENIGKLPEDKISQEDKTALNSLMDFFSKYIDKQFLSLQLTEALANEKYEEAKKILRQSEFTVNNSNGLSNLLQEDLTVFYPDGTKKLASEVIHEKRLGVNPLEKYQRH